MDIDIQLSNVGLRQIIRFKYNLMDCLFNVITYLVNYSKTSIIIQTYLMVHLQDCLIIETLEALLCRKCELNKYFMHDLHHGQVDNKIVCIQKMSLPPNKGGLWGDFTKIYLQYLQQQIHVWNKNNGEIMVKIGDNMNGIILNIVYKKNHFEPIELYGPTISLQSSNNVVQSNLNNQHFVVSKQHVYSKPKNETLKFDFVNNFFIITK